MQENTEITKAITFDDLAKEIKELGAEEFIIEVPFGGDVDGGR